MKKRFLALLLTFCLVLSLCSVTAFAEGENNSLPEANNGVITLTSDVTLSSTYEISSNVTINLAGHTITGNHVRALWVKSGTLTLTGEGTVTTVAGTGDDAIADSSSVIRVGDANTNTSAAGLVIDSDVTIKAPATYGVTVFGKNSELTLDVKGVVEAIGTEPAISGNGSSGLAATTITIESGAKVNAGNETTATAAIYQPQAGTLTIKDGAKVTSSNGAGIVARSGNIVIEGGTISGGGTNNFTVGDSSVEVPKSAVVYDSSASYPGLSDENENGLDISGGNFTAADGVEAIAVVASEEDNNDTITVTITGGTFSSDVSEYVSPECSYDSSTGTVAARTETDMAAVAKIGDKVYSSLTDAITAAQSDDTVLLLKDATETVVIKTNITLDLNGKKLTAANARTYAVNIGSGDANVTVTIQNGTLTGGSSCVVQMYSGKQSLTLDGVTVTSANGAGGIWDFGTNSSLTLTDCDVSGDYFAIYHNGSTAPFTLTAKGSTITAIKGSVAGACAIYVSGSSTNPATTKNKIKLTGCTVTGPTGIEGKYTDITLTNCTITATADVSFEQNSNGSTALGFAVVSTDNSKTPTTPAPEATITINSGTYVGLIGLSHFKETNVGTEATYVVNGGSFSESVSDYVIKSLTAELISSNKTDTPYSYYADVTAAEEVAQPGDLIVDLSKEASEVQILGVGFNATAEGANTAMNAIIANLGGSNTVNDSDVNTMWAFLKLSDTATTYTLTVTKNAVKVYTQELENASGLYYVYFTFNTENVGSPAKQEIASSTYTVTLTTGADEDKVTKTAEITLAKVSFNLNNGTLVDENGNNATPADTYYAAGSTVKLPTPTRSGSYRFNGWSDGSGTYTGTYTVPADGKDITLTDSWTYTGGSGGGTTTYSITVASVSNGSVTASPTSAGKGTTVTLTVAPDDGYELSSLTVTDAGGSVLTLTDNGNEKYTFTMPASKVTVSATFTGIESEHNCPSKIFTDVDITQYYHEAVDWAVLNGVTNGTSATTFSPDASCTRAQMVTFLWRAAGSPAPTSTTTPFTDVESGAYYYDAVLWAVEKGITDGTSATTFSPNETVTRGQTVTFLYRYAGSPTVSGGNNFTDVPTDAYYADAIQWAVANEVTYGTSTTTFSPENDCTRAQIVTFLYRDLAE